MRHWLGMRELSVEKTQLFGIALGFLTIVYAILYCVFLYTTLVRVPVWDILDWVVFLFGDRAD